MGLAHNCLLFYHRDLLRDQLLLLGSIVGASLIIGIYSGFESYNWGLFRVRVLYWQFTWVRVLSSRSGRYRVLFPILSIPGSVSGSTGSRTSMGLYQQHALHTLASPDPPVMAETKCLWNWGNTTTDLTYSNIAYNRHGSISYISYIGEKISYIPI